MIAKTAQGLFWLPTTAPVGAWGKDAAQTQPPEHVLPASSALSPAQKREPSAAAARATASVFRKLLRAPHALKKATPAAQMQKGSAQKRF